MEMSTASPRLPNQQGGILHAGSRHSHHGRRTKHSATFAVDRKHLTVTTTYGKKTAEVSAGVQHQVLAHQLLEQLVKEEKARKGSTI